MLDAQDFRRWLICVRRFGGLFCCGAVVSWQELSLEMKLGVLFVRCEVLLGTYILKAASCVVKNAMYRDQAKETIQLMLRLVYDL